VCVCVCVSVCVRVHAHLPSSISSSHVISRETQAVQYAQYDGVGYYNVCCSVLQCVAVCRSVLQCAAR